MTPGRALEKFVTDSRDNPKPPAIPVWAMAAVTALVACALFLFVAPQLGGSSTSPTTRTKATLSRLKASIQMYCEENKTIPISLTSLVPEYVDSGALKDAWTRDLHFELNTTDPEHPYVLRSAGKDGVLNSADDLDVWTINP
jgi:hypothetical protein